MKILNGIEVDGPMKGTVQASAAGDIPILGTGGKLPGGLIPETAVPFTIPASAWTGTGPYTATITVASVADMYTPTIGPVNPDGAMREVLADAQITALSVSSAGAITLSADGDKPTVPISCVAVGMLGNRTGYVISTFGAGGGGTDFFLNVQISAQAGTPVLSGIAVTVTPSTGTAMTGTTDASGKASFSVKQGMSYTVALSKLNYTITPATQTVTALDIITDVTATCYEAPKCTVTCSGASRAGRTVTCTPASGPVLTGTTDANGQASFVFALSDYTITVNYPSGQGVSPASTSVSAAAGGVYTSAFTILDRPTAVITVNDTSSSGYAVGRTITATPSSGTAVTGTTGSDGKVSLTLMGGTAYTITCNAPTGYITPTAWSLNAVAGQNYTHTFDLYREAIVNVAVGPAAIRSGRTITFTASGFTAIQRTTDASGNATASLPEAAWTIACDTPTGYYTPASQSQTTVGGQTYSKTFSLDAMPILNVTVGPAAASSGRLVTSVGPTTVTGYTNASGTLALIIQEGTHTVSVTPPAGYLVPATQSVTATRNNTYSLTYALQTKPIVNVTVTDSSGGGNQSGRTITATNGTDTVTGTTNASGNVQLSLNSVGSYAISTNLPTGATANTVNITATAGGTHSAAITLTFDWTAGMTFNSTTFQTDSTGCLTYADTLASMTPVSNTNTTLGTVSTIGSWGLGDNPTTAGCEYAVFLDGAYYKQLNPANLKQYADGTNATSDVTNTNGRYNVMFVIPLRYTNGTGTKLTHSSISSNGTAYAHTYGGSTYNRLAIPVYPGYVANNKLVSISGVEPTRLQTRATFRTQAQANGTGWHLMNYYEWKLLKEMVFFAIKSFDGQRKIGQGVSTGSTYSPTTGQCDAMGPFAGDVSGTTSQVKSYVEQFWGGSWCFLDDVIMNTDGFWVGQNSNPGDTTTGKTNIGKPAGNGFTNAILTGATTWGMGTNASGSDSTGLCDHQKYTYDSTIRLAFVGGDADDGSSAGPSCSSLLALANSSTKVGARAAFVYNA